MWGIGRANVGHENRGDTLSNELVATFGVDGRPEHRLGALLQARWKASNTAPFPPPPRLTPTILLSISNASLPSACLFFQVCGGLERRFKPPRCVV